MLVDSIGSVVQVQQSEQMRLVGKLLGKLESFYFQLFDEVSDARKSLTVEQQRLICSLVDDYLCESS